MYGLKEKFSVLGERQMSIVFFSVQSSAGSTLSVQQWKMFGPPFEDMYRVGQIKRGHLTFLLVIIERINKIKRFLAGINYIKQQVT